MDPSIQNPAWRNDTIHEDMDEHVYNEEQSPGSRRPVQAKDTTEYSRRHESLSLEQYFDALDDPVSGRIDRSPANAEKKCQLTQQMSGEDVMESMRKVQEEAEKFARTACRGRRLSAYKQQKPNHSTHESTAALGTKPAPKNRRVESASLLEAGGGKCWSQAVRSLSDPLATARHELHHSLHWVGNRSEGGLRTAKRAPTFSKYLITRARGSHSDNSFLLRRGDRRTLLHKKRTTSEPGPRGNHSGRSGSVTVRSGNLILPRKQSLSAFKKELISTNRNVKARFAQPLFGEASVVQDATLLDNKRADQRNHFPIHRSSPRLSQRRDEADRLKKPAESLQNHGRKKRKRSNEPGHLGSILPQRLRSATRLAVVTEEKDDLNGRQSGGRSKSTKATDEKTVANLGKKERKVNIPDDTNMATDLRRYSQWPDDSGYLITARGCLLPARYNFSGIPGLDWICPVRSCRRCYPTQARLGPHFVAAHRSCLLNDNRDGTFTVVGKYKSHQNGKSRPALVKSKNPLTRDTPPMLQPQPPLTWNTAAQKMRFAANLKTARSTAALDSREVVTVDEMMLQAGFFALSSAETSGASDLSELSRTPSFQETHHSSRPHFSHSSGSNPPGYAISEEENTSSSPAHKKHRHENASNAPHDATKENWRLVRRFLTGRQFHLPKRGHFAALLSTPRVRELTLRPGLRFVADQPKKVRVLIAHMTGEELPVPCNSCDRGQGPFKKCVAISKAAAGETTNGTVCCTNCATKRGLPQKCNVEVLLNQPLAVQDRKPRRGRRAPEERQQSSLGENNGTSRVTKVDGRFILTVRTLPIDGSIHFDREPVSVRLCSVAVGKVTVDAEGNPPFLIGTHGMFKLMPEMTTQVSNASEAEAVLHISTLKS